MSTETVYHGDCLRVLPRLAARGVRVHSVVTSPPYAEQRRTSYGGVPERIYPAWTVAWMREARKILAPGGSVLVNIREHVKNGEMSDYVHRTRMALRADGWVECDELIWVKPDGMPTGGPARPRRSWERILWFSPSPRPFCDAQAGGKPTQRIGGSAFGKTQKKLGYGESVMRAGYSRTPDWVNCSVRANTDTGHEAAYPVPLASWMLRLVTPAGGTVLDPFFGSGTTGHAAREHGRGFIGIERMEKHAAAAAARLGLRLEPWT